MGSEAGQNPMVARSLVNFFAAYRRLRLLNLLTVPRRKRCGFSQEL
jgi:hypothetical protein